MVIKTKLGDLRGLEVAVHPMFTHPELMNAEPPKTAHAFLNVNYSDPVPRFSVSPVAYLEVVPCIGLVLPECCESLKSHNFFRIKIFESNKQNMFR